MAPLGVSMLSAAQAGGADGGAVVEAEAAVELAISEIDRTADAIDRRMANSSDFEKHYSITV